MKLGVLSSEIARPISFLMTDTPIRSPKSQATRGVAEPLGTLRQGTMGVEWMLERLMGRDAMHDGLRDVFDRYDADPRRCVSHTRRRTRRTPHPQRRARCLRPDSPSVTGSTKPGLPTFKISDSSATTTATGWLVAATIANTGEIAARVDVAVVGESDESIRQVDLAPGKSQPLKAAGLVEPVQIVIDPNIHVLQRGRTNGVPVHR